MDATVEFARNFSDVTYEHLPVEVVAATKKQILDLLGISIGGMSQRGVRELVDLILEWGGKEESTILGIGKKVPAPNAAQINASMAHALDFDDVHETAIIHPSVIAIPTSLAIAERAGNLSGKEFVASVALGVDMMCRLALATMPGEVVFKTGWHLTSVFGFLGAAATAARLLRLDEEQIVHAMGIGYHQSAGNGQCVIDGGLTKRLGPGFSVKGGVTAALMAQKGVTGARNCLEGESGLYRVYFQGKYDRNTLTQNLGEFFEGPNVAIKPYPCCRGIHPAIDACLAMVDEQDITPEKIETVKVYVTEDIRFLLCSPLEAKRNPRNQVDAQFSVPWGVATALAKKRAVLSDFSDEAIDDETVLEITNKLVIEVDDSLRRGDKVSPARIEVRTKSGDVFVKEVIDPLGSIEAPMSFDDCTEKFRDCARILPKDNLDKIIEMVSNLEKSSDIGDLIQLLKI